MSDAPAEIRVIAGSCAGRVLPLDRDAFTVGRHGGVDLRFDPELDLDVSGHHALIGRDASRGWFVRDLGSTNGTFLNGAPVTGDVSLAPADRITFGRQGPEIEFRLVGPSAGAARQSGGAAGHSPATRSIPAAGQTGSPRAAAPRGSAAAGGVGGNRNRALAAAGAVAVLLTIGLAASYFSVRARSSVWEGERALLEERIDSLRLASQRTVVSLEVEIRDLADALLRSQEAVRQTTESLRRAQASGSPSEVASLGRQLDDATTTLERQEAVARLDFDGIQRGNRRAVAVIYVEGPDGRVNTGTAFAVRPDATLITSRHVVAGVDGTQRPRRIAIQFTDSDQVWPARILGIAADSDLAVVKVDNILGDVPTVRAFNLRPDTIAVGGVVASMGFPVGRDVSGEAAPGGTRTPDPLLSAGIISAVAADRLEIHGYGAAGASGSPIFDAEGSVVAVLFGGLLDAGQSTLLGVPAARAVSLLESVP